MAVQLQGMTVFNANVTKCMKCEYMRAAPKVKPPIYFHGNYNRYKEHNNTI